MSDTLNYQGIWFLPNEPENQVAGTLQFSISEGIELNLLGAFRHQDSDHVNIIHGISADGTRITLLKSFRFKRGFNTRSFQTSSYDSVFMFLGRLFDSCDELQFDEINCILQDFEHWINIYGFTKIEFNEESKETLIQYTQPTNISYSISDALECVFGFSTYAPVSIKTTKATIKQVCETSLRSKKQQMHFDELFDNFQTFYRLITLSNFGKPLIKELTVGKNELLDDGKLFTNRYKVYFKREISGKNAKRREHRHQFLFTYYDISHRFEDIIQKWYQIARTLEPVILSLSESFTMREQPTEFKFLNLAHAIETFHRRTKKGEAFSKAEFNTRMSAIIRAVPSKYADWLKSKLEFANEISLHERVENLIHSIPPAIHIYLFKPNIDTFIKNFKHSRNYYTHYNASLEKKALTGSELYQMAERMKIFLVCIVLNEMGLHESEVEAIILKKGAYLFNHIVKPH